MSDNPPIITGDAGDWVPKLCPLCSGQICVVVAEHKNNLMWRKDDKFYIERQVSPTNFDVLSWECGSCGHHVDYDMDREWIKIRIRDVVRR